jgi:hypothetical protein
LCPRAHEAGKGTALLGLVQTSTFEELSANCALQLKTILRGWQLLIIIITKTETNAKTNYTTITGSKGNYQMLRR